MKRIYSNLNLEYCRSVGVSILRVKVEYLGHIKNILGNRREEEIEIKEGSSVADLLSTLSSRYGEPFKKAVYETGGSDVKPNFMATVNGYLLNQLDGIRTKLKQGDDVILMPVVSGG
jgi:molybdopterin synthase sulfur carrier subunit